MNRRFASISLAVSLAVCLSLILSLVPVAVAQTSTSTSTAAAMPRLVRFGGVVKDLNGNPLTGVVGVTFALYSEQTGGAALWLETQNVTADGNGHYSALLGSTKPDGLPPELFTSVEARWVGVQVSGQAEQARVLLVSAPYAFKAGDAETIGGLPPSAFVLANPGQGAAGTQSAAESVSTQRANASSIMAPTNPDVTGAGTTGYVPLWDASSDIVTSVLFQNGSGSSAMVGINTTSPHATLDVNGTVNANILELGAQAFAAGNFNQHSIYLGYSAGGIVPGKNPNVTAVGASALFLNKGSNNTAIGTTALTVNTTGADNTASGYKALSRNQTGSENTASGSKALANNTAGSYNAADGYSALINNGIGSYNSALGFQAGPDASASNLTNATAIGAYADVTSSNSLVLGSISGKNGASSNTNVGIGTTAPLFSLDVHGTGNFTGAVTFNSPVTFESGQTFPNTISGVTTANNSGLAGGGTTGNLNLSLTSCPLGQVLASNGPNSGWGCAAVSGGGGGGVTSTGTANYLPLFTSVNGSTIANSSLFQSTTAPTIGYIGINQTNPAATLDVNGSINLPNTTSGASGVLSLGGTPFVNNYGVQNVFVGASAGNMTLDTTLASVNTAVGYGTLTSNTLGQQNSAFGGNALEANTTGNGNAALGADALIANSTGVGNTAVGNATLLGNATGEFDTALGFQAGDMSAAGLNYATAIGAYADVTQPNSLVLGSIAGVNGCDPNATIPCLSTMVGIGTTAPQYTLDVHGTANFTGAVNFANSTVGSSTVFGNNTATSGFGTNGGSFSTASSAGTGVVGQNFSTAGGYGGYFSSASAVGAGAQGVNSSASGGYGGLFSAAGASGIGVSGTGGLYGGLFYSASGIGAVGGGAQYGGYFSATNASGIGLYAANTNPGAVAGYFSGSVQVTGAETVGGNLTSSGVVTGSSFQIGSNPFGYGSYTVGNAFLGFAGNGTNGSTGGYNTASGYQALLNNSGYGNTASGANALYSNQGGIVSGAYAGSDNTASGAYALYSNCSGGCSIGFQGLDNTATGFFALSANTVGSNNTAGGAYALYDTTGGDNTASGAYSLYRNSAGSYNTGLGYFAGPDRSVTSPLSYATAIGADADVTKSNALVLGSIAGLNGCDPTATPACQSTMVGIGTTAPQATLDVESPSATTPPTVTFGSASIPAIFTLNGSANFTGAAMFGSTVGFLSTQTFPNTVSAVTAGIGLMGGGTGNVTLSLPTCPITQVLLSTGGGWTCAAVSGGGGGITETGTITANSLPLFSSTPNTVTSSNVFQGNAGNVGIGTTTPQATLDVNGIINLPNAISGYVGTLNIGGLPFLSNYPGTNFSANTFVGTSAGNQIMAGSAIQNTAVGNAAFSANTIGYDNSAFGFDALNANTTGNNNSAFGEGTLQLNTSGFNNSAFGEGALGANKSGNGNSGFGNGALSVNETGIDNTAVGVAALEQLGESTGTGGSSNIAIGFLAGYNLTGVESNNIDIGSQGVLGESNTIRIGSTQTNAYIAGTVNVSNLIVSGSCTGCGGSGGGGTITGVTAGTGLKGGGMSGNVTLTLDPSATNTFTGTQTFNNGILASISSNSNAGISGSNNSALGPGAGVAGFSASGSGSGVVGTNSSQSLGGGYGVQGLSYNTADPGVGGINNAPNGSAYGVWGQSLSSTGTGVYGTGNGSGVTGSTSSPTGTGVVATNFATSGSAYGVFAQSTSSPGGTGVYGTGTGTGVSGFSSLGYGVVGQSNGTVSGSAGVYGSATTAAGIGVLGSNNAGGWAGFFSGPVLVQGGTLQSTGDVSFQGNASIGGNAAIAGNTTITGTLAIGGDTPMSHSPRMTFSGTVASFTTSPQAAGYFIPDQPIVITRFTAAVGGGQNSLCTSPEYMSLTINGTDSAAKVFAAGMPDSTPFTDSGALNILVSAGTPIYMYGNSASGIGCQSGNNITATVEYAMQ